MDPYLGKLVLLLTRYRSMFRSIYVYYKEGSGKLYKVLDWNIDDTLCTVIPLRILTHIDCLELEGY